MRMIRAVLAISALIAIPAVAPAGPIEWSYSSSGARSGAYEIDPASIAFVTSAGQTQDIYLIGGAQLPLLISPMPLQGPTLWTQVTITDAGSGRSGMFFVPIEFSNPVPSLESGFFQYVPQVGSITPVDLVMGGHIYLVTNGPDRGLSVQVEATPEPASIILAGLSLMSVGLARLRRRFSPITPVTSTD